MLLHSGPAELPKWSSVTAPCQLLSGLRLSLKRPWQHLYIRLQSRHTTGCQQHTDDTWFCINRWASAAAYSKCQIEEWKHWVLWNSASWMSQAQPLHLINWKWLCRHPCLLFPILTIDPGGYHDWWSWRDEVGSWSLHYNWSTSSGENQQAQPYLFI